MKKAQKRNLASGNPIELSWTNKYFLKSIFLKIKVPKFEWLNICSLDSNWNIKINAVALRRKIFDIIKSSLDKNYVFIIKAAI